MLVEFTVGNFRSFREKQTLSLISCGGKDKKHPDHLIPCGKMKLLKAVSVFGANASGKSNLIKAIGVMKSFVGNSASQMNQGDPIRGVVPFKLDRRYADQPSFFSAHVVLSGSHYEYSFSATSQRVYSEKLVVSLGNSEQVWFERALNNETGNTEWRFAGPLKDDGELIERLTRPNGLGLSRGAELNIAALVGLFLWFKGRMWCFDLAFDPSPMLAQETATRMAENPSRSSWIANFLRHADFGIEDLVVEDRDVEALGEIPHEMKELLSEKGMGLIRESVPKLDIRFLHRGQGSEPVEFDLMSESNGTQRFFALMGPFLDALDQGTVMVVDELEASMHPLLTRKFVELFQSPEANKKGAQLIFATHDSSLMDPTLFRRDQVWLAEKNREGASELFSLYDFDSSVRPRSEEAFERNYLAGRYGAVPSFGPTLEDLEFSWESQDAE